MKIKIYLILKSTFFRFINLIQIIECKLWLSNNYRSLENNCSVSEVKKENNFILSSNIKMEIADNNESENISDMDSSNKFAKNVHIPEIKKENNFILSSNIKAEITDTNESENISKVDNANESAKNVDNDIDKNDKEQNDITIKKESSNDIPESSQGEESNLINSVQTSSDQEPSQAFGTNLADETKDASTSTNCQRDKCKYGDECYR